MEKSRRIFFEIHSDLPREGPGCFAATKQAFDMLSLPPHPLILDAGCGPGQQTMDLASLCGGEIVALDNHAPYLAQVKARAARDRVSQRVTTCLGDMASLPFPPATFDLIWSEGAIYIIGFASGLKLWKPFLKPGGFVAVTEITWLKPDPPPELRAFWQEAYPPLTDTAGNLAYIEQAGFRTVGCFPLPASAWWDDYYQLIEDKLPNLRAKYQDDAEAHKILDEEAEEVELHRRYGEYYGYVFYVMQNP